MIYIPDIKHPGYCLDCLNTVENHKAMFRCPGRMTIKTKGATYPERIITTTLTYPNGDKSELWESEPLQGKLYIEELRAMCRMVIKHNNRVSDGRRR